MTTTRAQRADALERWADDVDAEDLVEARTAALRTIAELVEQRDDVDMARHDIGRDAFLERAWAQKEASAGSIIDQMRQLGASPDWERLQFTLDAGPQQAVRTLFTRLFDDGLIYRAERPNPWCPRCTTALSDIELDTDDHGIERCSRCATITERRTTTQWFLRTPSLAALARDAYTSGELEIQPPDMGDAYLDWCDNMHDWCLSRQLWWGHRLPIWHGPDGEYAAFEHDDDIPDCWTQDDDILDTWFSSALWPLSTLGWPQQTADLDRYYPSTLLCTGYDLLFFWAIRMIMLSTYASGTPPFKMLHLHGMIRDANGKKMSKSFGNTIDAIRRAGQRVRCGVRPCSGGCRAVERTGG